MGGNIGCECLVVAAVRREYDRERAVSNVVGEGRLEGAGGVGGCIRGIFEGVVDGRWTVCYANGIVEACDVGLLRYERNGNLTKRAARCECWDRDAVDGGVWFDAGVFPLGKRDELA